jgi:hypothetical protein
MDEEYVQEHILTGGIVARVGRASPTHSWPLRAISLSVVASCPTHHLLVWLLLCLSRSESHGLPRRRRMTKRLESPIRCGQRGVIITCNSAFAGLQQLTYRLGNCALPLMHGHRSDFRSANDHDFFVSRMDAVASEGVRTMLRKTMIVLATVAALTGGLTVDAFAHGGGGGGGGHGGGFGGGGGHGGGFGGGHFGGGFGGGHFGGGHFGGGHFGGGHFGGAEIGRGFAGSHFAGRHGNFGRERGFDRDRGFDHRRFGRGFGFVPSWDYGLYDYGCSYG